ncbi:hypothetical protein EYR41_006226 [Orbilia oligospora]|uniref:Uncharacterized protein n=1 Tax=Orbilia oligospora TaxID=2813651 RepID=A0A7C8JYB4_ORBOL|nr:hypothetical protein TWF751_001342 [Orbilia oligospora]KAF3274210.1 hypothetical protein TWF132_003769 [Orbilia oligospora]TGJ70247.1 hypothetical protein EYR41_006226 [Orbilia oligospora]
MSPSTVTQISFDPFRRKDPVFAVRLISIQQSKRHRKICVSRSHPAPSLTGRNYCTIPTIAILRTDSYSRFPDCLFEVTGHLKQFQIQSQPLQCDDLPLTIPTEGSFAAPGNGRTCA